MPSTCLVSPPVCVFLRTDILPYLQASSVQFFRKRNDDGAADCSAPTGGISLSKAKREDKTMQVKPEFQQMSRQEIEAHLISKATSDQAFRQELISDPRAALEKEIGLKVPADFKLQVIEETSNSLSLVLPPAQGELSDMELEGVAGGKGSSSKGAKPPAQIMKGGRMVAAGGCN